LGKKNSWKKNHNPVFNLESPITQTPLPFVNEPDLVGILEMLPTIAIQDLINNQICQNMIRESIILGPLPPYKFRVFF